MPELRFVSWSAVSSRPQAEKESLPDQRRLNHEFVARLGHHYLGYSGVVVADLEVVGSRSIVELKDAITAYPDAYGELVRLVQASAVDAVVCRSRDRLGRTDALIVTLERMCLEHGVIVVPRQSMPATLDAALARSSEGGGLTAAIEGFLAGTAVKRLVNEQRRGMLARVRVNKQFPAALPWGYTYRYTPSGVATVQIEQSAAGAIREMFRLYTQEHRNYREIANALNAGGHPSVRGDAWTENMTKHIIGNADAYAGKVTLNRRSKTGREFVQVDGQHTPILSAPDYQAFLEIRNARSVARVGRGHAFSGIVVCLACGRPMSSQVQYYTRNNARTAYRRLRCTRCTPQHSIAEEEIEDALLGAIDRLSENADLSAFYQQVQDSLRNGYDTAQEGAADAARLLALIEQKQQRLLELYLNRDDILPAHFDAEMKKLNREADGLRLRLEETQNAPASGMTAEQLIEQLRSIKNIGRRLIENRDADPRGAQLWLSQVVRVEVKPEDRGTRIVGIRWLV